jgi:antitoxin PrlF
VSAEENKKKQPDAGSKKASCCKVQSIITVDERGQMVLPKEVREQAGIGPGDKLAVVSMESGGKICCLALMKIDALADAVKDVLGPVMKDM